LNPLNHHLNLAAAGLLTIEPGRYHARVIEHQQVILAYQLINLAKNPVLKLSRLGVDTKQLAVTATLSRISRDELLRKVIVKIRELQDEGSPVRKSAQTSRLASLVQE